MMPEIILYLLKVNLALVLFYAGYHFILQRYTFHSINRFYLLLSIVYSALYPLINLTDILNRNEDLKETIVMIAPNWQGSVVAEDNAAFYWQVALIIFWTGVAIMTIRLFIQLASLLILHAQSSAITKGDIKYRKISKAVNPFSFWRTIYLNPECHEAGELQSILEHELVHVKQLHTFDVMLAEISTILYWFNPGAWLMKKAIKANLEFITDQEVIRSGIDSKEYQYTLLKTHALPQNQMPVNNFHFLTIKKRIAMINKKPSNKINLSNYFLLLPAIMLLVLLAGVSKADFTRKGVVDAITNMPVLPLDRVFTDNTEANQVEVKKESITTDQPDPIEDKKPTLQTSPQDTIKNGTVKISGINEQAPPLYIVDGKEMPARWKDLEPNTIATVDVYKGEAAIARYGEKGKNGVIEIRTKLAGSGQNIESSKPKLATADGSNQNQNVSLKNIDKQLIILDGKEISKSELEQMKVSSIVTINILKGNSAVSQYGEKGENGVIVITTK
ncbi:MAG: M56 family metallopeptidase [Daejeonella sp.]|uniref:M56 family metallopeptidase n=1 Tax=Daejeonella sp. TaxID=2805397 RepID=UPI003C73347C